MPIQQLTTPNLRANNNSAAFQALSQSNKMIDSSFDKMQSGLDGLNKKINLDPNQEVKDKNTLAVMQALQGTTDPAALNSFLEQADASGVEYDKASALKMLQDRDNTIYKRQEDLTKHNIDINKFNIKAKNNVNNFNANREQRSYEQTSRNQQSANNSNAKIDNMVNEYNFKNNRIVKYTNPYTGEVMEVRAIDLNALEQTIKYEHALSLQKQQNIERVKQQVKKATGEEMNPEELSALTEGMKNQNLQDMSGMTAQTNKWNNAFTANDVKNNEADRIRDAFASDTPYNPSPEYQKSFESDTGLGKLESINILKKISKLPFVQKDKNGAIFQDVVNSLVTSMRNEQGGLNSVLNWAKSKQGILLEASKNMVLNNRDKRELLKSFGISESEINASMTNDSLNKTHSKSRKPPVRNNTD